MYVYRRDVCVCVRETEMGGGERERETPVYGGGHYGRVLIRSMLATDRGIVVGQAEHQEQRVFPRLSAGFICSALTAVDTD